MAADLAGLDVADDGRLARLGDPQYHDGVGDAVPQVPVLPGPDAAEGVGLLQHRERGTAVVVRTAVRGGVGLGERVALRELATAVQGQDLLETAAGFLGDAAQLLEDVRQIAVDHRHPRGRPVEDLLPGKAGRASHRLGVEGHRAGDLFAGGLAVLAASLTGIRGGEVDRDEL